MMMYHLHDRTFFLFKEKKKSVPFELHLRRSFFLTAFHPVTTFTPLLPLGAKAISRFVNSTLLTLLVSLIRLVSLPDFSLTRFPLRVPPRFLLHPVSCCTPFPVDPVFCWTPFSVEPRFLLNPVFCWAPFSVRPVTNIASFCLVSISTHATAS